MAITLSSPVAQANITEVKTVDCKLNLKTNVVTVFYKTIDANGVEVGEGVTTINSSSLKETVYNACNQALVDEEIFSGTVS